MKAIRRALSLTYLLLILSIGVSSFVFSYQYVNKVGVFADEITMVTDPCRNISGLDVSTNNPYGSGYVYRTFKFETGHTNTVQGDVIRSLCNLNGSNGLGVFNEYADRIHVGFNPEWKPSTYTPQTVAIPPGYPVASPYAYGSTNGYHGAFVDDAGAMRLDASKGYDVIWCNAMGTRITDIGGNDCSPDIYTNGVSESSGSAYRGAGFLFTNNNAPSNSNNCVQMTYSGLPNMDCSAVWFDWLERYGTPRNGNFTSNLDVGTDNGFLDSYIDNFNFYLLAKNTWPGGYGASTTLSTRHPQRNAACTVNTVPGSMTAGQSTSVTLTYNNTGRSTWYRNANSRGVSYYIQNTGDNFGIANTIPIGPSRVTAGNNATYNLNITAPSTPGTYVFEYTFAQSNVGPYTTSSADCRRVVTVTAPSGYDYETNIQKVNPTGGSVNVGDTITVRSRVQNFGSGPGPNYDHRIQRSTNSGSWVNILVLNSEIGLSNGSASSYRQGTYTVPSGSEGDTICFRARVAPGAGQSPPSSVVSDPFDLSPTEVCYTVITPTPLLSCPATDITSTSVRLVFSGVSHLSNARLVRVSPDPVNPLIPISSDGDYTDNGLNNSTDYRYRIDDNNGTQAGPITCTTLAPTWILDNESGSLPGSAFPGSQVDYSGSISNVTFFDTNTSGQPGVLNYRVEPQVNATDSQALSRVSGDPQNQNNQSVSANSTYQVNITYSVPTNATVGEDYCITIKFSGNSTFDPPNGTQIRGFQDGAVTQPGPLHVTVCVQIADFAYLKVQNSGVWNGATWDSFNRCQSGIKIGTPGDPVQGQSASRPSGDRIGSSAQFGVMSMLTTVNDFASAHLPNVDFTSGFANRLTFANDPSDGTFLGLSTQPVKCIPRLYGTFDSEAPAGTENLSEINTNSAYSGGETSASKNAYLTRHGNVTGGTGGTPFRGKAVVIVDGNLQINGNIEYDTSNYNNSGSLQVPSLVFIVRGNIRISPSVTRLDGLYFSQERTISTCFPSGSNINPACGNDQLQINGAVVASDINFYRFFGGYNATTSGSAPNQLANAAEVFNLSPELYIARPFLGLFRDSSNPFDQPFQSYKEKAPIY